MISVPLFIVSKDHHGAGMFEAKSMEGKCHKKKANFNFEQQADQGGGYNDYQQVTYVLIWNWNYHYCRHASVVLDTV